jgi:hypothetical protein
MYKYKYLKYKTKFTHLSKKEEEEIMSAVNYRLPE